MNKLIQILFGVSFVIFTPIITVVLLPVKYIKTCYSNGCFTYTMLEKEKMKSKDEA